MHLALAEVHLAEHLAEHLAVLRLRVVHLAARSEHQVGALALPHQPQGGRAAVRRALRLRLRCVPCLLSGSCRGCFAAVQALAY